MSEEDFEILNDLKEYVTQEKEKVNPVKSIKVDKNYKPSLEEIEKNAISRLCNYNISRE